MAGNAWIRGVLDARLWALIGATVVLLALLVASAQAFTLIPTPGIHYSATDEGAGTTNGVSPDSAPSGTPFTFYVKYFDPSGSPGAAPMQANLLLDLDGNGVVGGTVTPFARPAWPSYLLAVLALAWVLSWLLARRMPRWRTAFSAAGVALAIMLVTIGCGGSSGGGGGTAIASHAGLAVCSSPTSETVPMDDHAVAGDYGAGALFTAQVTLNCQPGLLLFMFDFKNSSGVPIGFGTAPNLHTLVITP
jgi:hypothetical protein